MKNSILTCVSLYNYQVLSITLFVIGLIGILISRNFIKLFVSLEFLVNSVNILFISFASYNQSSEYTGYTFVIFISAISAIILAVGIYFTYLIYKRFGTIEISKVYEKYKDTKVC